MTSLRAKVIKLAYNNPELRADLLPLLKKAGVSRVLAELRNLLHEDPIFPYALRELKIVSIANNNSNNSIINEYLEGHGWDFSKKFRRVSLVRSDLSGLNLNGIDFEGAEFREANLQGVNLKGANLKKADLTGADLKKADLEGANLMYADLRDTIFDGSNLSGTNLKWADLRGADLKGADLKGANLINISYDTKTIWPKKGDWSLYETTPPFFDISEIY